VFCGLGAEGFDAMKCPLKGGREKNSDQPGRDRFAGTAARRKTAKWDGEGVEDAPFVPAGGGFSRALGAETRKYFRSTSSIAFVIAVEDNLASLV
jgi:hypothetical protein